jgi:hypothetical protein
MLLLATGPLLIMIDLDREGKHLPKFGMFRAFRSVSGTGTSASCGDRALGFKQSFLRGHTNPVGLIEVGTLPGYTTCTFPALSKLQYWFNH